jgi:hypothetical protein
VHEWWPERTAVIFSSTAGPPRPAAVAGHGSTPRAGRLYAAWMPGALATRIIVFGRGLVAEGTGFRLTRQSSEHTEALVAYARQNAPAFAVRRGRIVSSGGWAGAAEGFDRPPHQYREGSLMRAQTMAADIGGAGLADYAEVYAEVESDSTLENVLRVKRTVASPRACSRRSPASRSSVPVSTAGCVAGTGCSSPGATCSRHCARFRRCGERTGTIRRGHPG